MVIRAPPAERAGAAASISETSNQLGIALGIAVMGSIGTAVYRSQITRLAPAGTASVTDAADGIKHVANRRGYPAWAEAINSKGRRLDGNRGS